jgi:hypothetical protein
MHNIKYLSYHCSASKRQIEKRLNAYVAREDWEEGASGLPSPIRWIDKVFKTYDEAEAYIEGHDRGWYDCLAVKYKVGRKIYWLVKIEYHT